MKNNWIHIVSIVMLIFGIWAGIADATIVGSPHDLSPDQDGSMACQYCHTPHQALAGTPLWNHKLSDKIYHIYWSTSLDAEVGQPTGANKLCLSCHDGTVALETTLQNSQGSTFIPPGRTRLGTDLSDDHPVSFVYSEDLSIEDTQILSPESLPPKINLDQYGELQCVTCHNPHNNSFGHFLVIPNQGSDLCLKCHNLKGWTNTVHESSTALIDNADDDYLRNSEFRTVADNGCSACHRPHSSGEPQRLLHFKEEENNCLNCHNGQVAATDLAAELNKLSGHKVRNYEGIHDLKENINSAEEHVECVDCHNPHALINTPAQAPLAPDVLQMVSGVTAEDNFIEQVIYEYEVCFKCHGSNPNRVDATVHRVITQMRGSLKAGAI
ncbi:MAG: hypothetical protein JW860_13790 [Sedimentisphaerales bacterium]|nr:hypothetical protein [Sedimentisphaerales bacterium]